MSLASCPSCRGEGHLAPPDWDMVCCGNFLDSGECCTAVYGSANLVMVPVFEACPTCGGKGYIEYED